MGKYLIEGNKLKRQGKLEEAIASYKRAIEINPNSAWSYHNLGETLAKVARLDEAIISYGRAIEINPNSAWSYYELGEVLAAKGDFDAALINYRRAWELEPNFEGFTRGLENALEKLSDRRQNQESGPTFFKQAKSHFAKRFWSETVRSCRQAIEAGLEEAECYKMLGWSLKKQRQWDEAIAAYLKVIELNPKDGDAYYWLGDILRMRGRLGEAIALYQKGVATLPENVQLKEGLQQFTAEQKQREINQQANKQLSNYRQVASREKQVGNWQKAAEAYKQAIEILPNASDYYDLGILLIENQAFTEALLCLENLFKMFYKPGFNFKKCLSLGIALVNAGQLKEVIDIYDRTFQKKLEYLDFYYQLTIRLPLAGLMREGVAFFKEWPKPLPYDSNSNIMETAGNLDSQSIYDKIWSLFNRLDVKELNDFIAPEIDITQAEAYKYFTEVKPHQSFLWNKLSEEKKSTIEKLGISLEYLQYMRMENNELENIYINSFGDFEVPQQRTTIVRKKQLSCHPVVNNPIEFIQSIVEFGYMYALCPFSGEVVRSDRCFYMGGYSIIYRFVGREVFYLELGGYTGEKVSIYCPKFNLEIWFNMKFKAAAQDVFYLLKSYVVSSWEKVKNYLNNSQKKTVAAIYGMTANLGHSLWNDVTGIYHLYENQLFDKINYFCVGKHEYYGLKSMFPEVYSQKIIDFSKMSLEEQFKFFLDKNSVCLRMADAYIKQSMCDRIHQGARQQCSEEFLQLVETAKENHQLLLWINVRTHNKSWVNQEENYSNIVNLLSDRFPDLKIAIILDGTPDAGACAESIINQIKPQIKTYNTLGCPLFESIVWAGYIDAYIATVGSGLTMTSWLHDKPGVAHGDRAHLGQQGFWSKVKENSIAPVFVKDEDVINAKNEVFSDYQLDWKIVGNLLVEILKSYSLTP